MKLVVLLSVFVAMVAAIPPHTSRPREAKTPEEQAVSLNQTRRRIFAENIPHFLALNDWNLAEQKQGSWPEARPATAFVPATAHSTQTLARLLSVVLVVETRPGNHGDVFNGYNQQGSRDTTIQIDGRSYGRSGLQDSTFIHDVTSHH
ncbi:hypothetical protein GQ607_016911 [Colletotrichum asianum]|uniref:Uncharacterized protein n=1 Tax=Colletotrichum asianum TaxID=702518 RepID=A0A8H3W027_9PEZI|nr:hypothetical protein GQ607_016911 [Colletotrichum asianum]